MEVYFYLATGGMTSRKEVLAYDFYDLLGNVGGFLGLFLGVSVLSLFDVGAGRLLKVWRTCASTSSFHFINTFLNYSAVLVACGMQFPSFSLLSLRPAPPLPICVDCCR